MVIEPHMKQGRQHKLISTIFLATSVTKKLDHNRYLLYHRRTFHRTFTEKVSHSRSMKRIGTALTIVFIIAGFAISFFIGHYVSDKSHTESRAAQFDKYISRAIDTIKDKGLSIDGAPEAIASNIWVAHEFCDSPEISAELSNLWNTIVYEKDVLLGQEDVLTAQLKDILEKCQ